MDIDPFKLRRRAAGHPGQRLVRTLCKDCKEAYAPEQAEFAELMEEYGVETGTGWASSTRQTSGSTARRAAPSAPTRGYKGRMGSTSCWWPATSAAPDQKRSPIEHLRNQAMSDGMTTLLQDGIQKVIAGHTDFKQVRAVCIK